ncbi:MAG: LacI family DNA-binding transcriptional regulator, partial [Planctomycetes bacterium]|nr:LacI family DNA-binding transcriptional regulator [Planctomycetota bacterium]
MMQSELAELLGVSQYTVSVALSGKGRVSEKVRKRILAAAKEYGYRPNKLAAGLRGAKTQTVGIIWNFIDMWAGDTIIALNTLHH